MRKVNDILQAIPIDCAMRWRTFLCAALLGFASTGTPSATPAISAGGRGHSIALSVDGTVRTWGNDTSGQLGVGRSLESSKALVVTGATGIKKLPRAIGTSSR